MDFDIGLWHAPKSNTIYGILSVLKDNQCLQNLLILVIRYAGPRGVIEKRIRGRFSSLAEHMQLCR